MSTWQITRIDQCARIVGGSTPKTSVKDYWDGEIYWATPKDLSNLESPNLEGTPRRITKAGLDSCGAEVLPEGSVLFSSRAPIGHVAINCVPMATNQGFKSFVPDPEKLDSKFLYYWLRKNRAYFNSLGNGATFKEVSKAIVSRIEIPLPQIAQQKRIAAILDKAESLRSLRRQALGELDALTQSIFLKMFGDPVTNPKKWISTTSLGDVANIASGITKGRKLNGQAIRVIPYLAVINVQDKELNLDVVKNIEATEDEINRYRLKKDDLLLTEGGDPDKLGRGTLWNEEISECIHQNHVFRVRLTAASVHPLFLNWLIGSQRGKKYFLKSAKQTTGIATINMSQLREFPLLIPPLPLQQEFARRVEAIEQLKATHRESLAHLDTLFASLQHRAFQGEL